MKISYLDPKKKKKNTCLGNNNDGRKTYKERGASVFKIFL